MFLRNCWYVAAWGHEVGRALKPIKVLGEEIVLYRQTDGVVAALEDACPHRKLPLSMGRLKGDNVECGYHGLTFDCSGACTRVPGAEKIPHVARVQRYPIVERYGLLWIWMGAAKKADPAKIFEVQHWGDPAWGVNRGETMAVDCNYLYVTDNLLDPSHVSWVHQTSFGGVQAMEDVPMQTTVGESGVTSWRWMMNMEPSPFYAQFLRFKGNCDRKQHYEMRYPCNAIIKAIFTPAGTGGDDRKPHEDVFLMDSYNFMTPVDETHTNYTWFQMRNFAPGDEEVSRIFTNSVRAAFEEDRIVLNAVQKGMANKRTPNLDLRIDVGPLRFRRNLDKLIEAESVRLAAE